MYYGTGPLRWRGFVLTRPPVRCPLYGFIQFEIAIFELLGEEVRCQPWERILPALGDEVVSPKGRAGFFTPFCIKVGPCQEGVGWHCNKKQVTHFLHAKFAYLSDFYAIYVFVIFYFYINPPAFPLPVLKSSPLNPENLTLLHRLHLSITLCLHDYFTVFTKLIPANGVIACRI